MSRYTLLLVLSGALAISAPLGAGGARTDVATLQKIASRVDDRTGIVTIEASAPVPYVASQPDPQTFVVELRDVVALGFADRFTADPRHPIGAVQVESASAADGVAVARVRMSLTHAVRPRVRSSKNVIYVEADRLDKSGKGDTFIATGPASAIRDVRVTRHGATGTAVTLLGTGRLIATSIEEAKDGPPRLVIDLPNVTSAMPGVVPVAQGPIQQVRIGLNAKSPLVTRVVVDLARRTPYRVEQSPGGHDLTVVFDEPSQEPMTPLATAPAAKTQMSAGQQPRSVSPPATARSASSGQALPPTPSTTSAQAQPAAAQPPLPAAQPGKYTGHPVSLDFQGADLRAVLRTFAEISGLNIVIDPTVQGTVDVALRDVPWDQALDIILRANKLGYIVDGTIVRIAPLNVLADEEAQRRKLAEEQALSGTLRVLTHALSYARAEDVAPLLTRTVLSQRGQIQTDVRTNTLIINDLPERLTQVTDLLVTLDRPQPQVEIEARIVQTNRNFARTLGVQWGVGARASTALGNTLPTAFPNQGSITGRLNTSQGAQPPDPGTDSVPTMVNLGAGAANSAIGIALGSINGAVNLDVALSALESSGNGRLLSTPRVATQNNVEAEITQGVQIPIQTIANNTVTVTFKDAALTLRVTPQITAANTVIMRISVENASPDFGRSVGGIPPIDTQRAITSVLVSDGDTTVIGGIYISREQATQDRTPALHRIPLLGWLFKRDALTEENRELLIFITPRIVRL
jgi:type IV pilus assembly protein PilQ